MPSYYIHPDSFSTTLSSDGIFDYALIFNWETDGKVVSYYDPFPRSAVSSEDEWKSRHFSTSSSRTGGYEMREEPDLKVSDFNRVAIYRVQLPVPYEISNLSDAEINEWFIDWWWNDINRNNTGAFELDISQAADYGEAIVFTGTQTKRYLQLVLAEVIDEAFDTTREVEHYPTGTLNSGPISPDPPVISATVTVTKNLDISTRLEWTWTDELWVDRMIGFEVQRAVDSTADPDFVPIDDQLGFDITSLVDDNIPFNERHAYQYRVRALTDLGVNSPWGIVDTIGGVDTPALTGVRVFYGVGNASMRTRTGLLDNDEYKFLKYPQIGEIDGLSLVAVIEGRYDDPFPPAADQILALNYESQEPLAFGPLAIGNIQMTASVGENVGIEFYHSSFDGLSGTGDYAIVGDSDEYDTYDPLTPNDRWLDWRFPGTLPMHLV